MIIVRFEPPSAITPRIPVMTSGIARNASTTHHVVDETAVVAHHQAERRAGDRPQRGGQRSGDEDVARAGDHPREHVAAELIGAEDVPRARLGVDVQQILGVGAADDRLPEDRAQDPEQDDDRADHECRLPHQRADELAAQVRRALAGGEGAGGLDGDGVEAHSLPPTRTRGLRKE
jgi:hypothetical protein